MRFIAQLGWSPILLALLAILLRGAAPAAQLEWIGGTDNSWHTPANWAPIVVPGDDPIHRVPQDGDTVLIADQEELDSLLLDWGDDLSLFDGLPAERGRTPQAGGVPEPATGIAVFFALLPLFAWKRLTIAD